MYRISFYVQAAWAEAVTDAMFTAGAGKIGEYEHCCWQSQGIGQFRPLKGSRPVIGEHGRLEKVEEVKVEMVCSEGCIKSALKALIAAHPYEEPAYGCWKLSTLENF
ncbi:MAG: NGG1p interacting factor NIF3 [Spirochaeta sp. LUC14_002_19_P3]|nr:MAG: NGG1p interacting factor NIF3 [Spirochaeta sp. LUC14_002_19_P3]